MSATNTPPAADAAALPEAGKAAGAAFQELTQAYQELATRNVENLQSAIKALIAVKVRRSSFNEERFRLASPRRVSPASTRTAAATVS